MMWPGRLLVISALAAAMVSAPAGGQNEAAPKLGWTDAGERPPAVETMTLDAPRPFGYMVGDRVRHRIAVTVADDTRLQTASLPIRRRIGEWLELQQVGLDEAASPGGRRYLLTLTYQIFSTPVGVDISRVPGFNLRFARAGESIPVAVPDWRFSQSPLLAGDIAREGENIVAMRPDVAPPTLATGGYRAGLAAFLALALAGGGWLAWLQLPRRQRRLPFTRAARALDRLEREPLTEDRLRAGYRLLHRGFDSTAGRAVFAGELDVFCHEHPTFQPERDGIDKFFTDSRALFFGREGPTPDSANWAALRILARRCRGAERRAP